MAKGQMTADGTRTFDGNRQWGKKTTRIDDCREWTTGWFVPHVLHRCCAHARGEPVPYPDRCLRTLAHQTLPYPIDRD